MLRSDLQTLKNLVYTGEGRRVLFAQAIVVVCVLVGSVALTGGVLLEPEVLDAVRGDTSGVLARFYFSVALTLPLMLVLGIGVAGSNTELFRAPQLPTLLTAPISSFAIVWHAFVRMGFGWALLCLAIGLPPIVGLADRTELPWTPMLMFPVAAALLLAPLLAAQCLLKVALVRWCSGPRVRLVFMGLNLVFLTALALAAGFGLLKGSDVAGWLAQAMQEQRTLPWFLDAPAGLLAWTAGLRPGDGVLIYCAILFVLPFPLLGLAAVLYRAAFEAHWVAGATTPRERARASSRDWPAHPLPSMLRKSFLESLRVRSNLIGYVFVAFLMVLALSFSGAVSPNENDKTPLLLNELFHTWMPWQVLVLLLASISFLAVIGEEQKQVSLFAMAPVSRHVILQSKILSVASPFAMCVLIVVVGAPALQGVSVSAVALFVLVAVPIVLATLGLLAMVGTWPTFTQLHGDVPLANSTRSVVPVLVIGGAMTGAMRGMIELKYVLKGWYNPAGSLDVVDVAAACWMVLAGLWVLGVVCFALFYRVGLRNVEVLLGHQVE